jgi:hypothetical protein
MNRAAGCWNGLLLPRRGKTTEPRVGRTPTGSAYPGYHAPLAANPERVAQEGGLLACPAVRWNPGSGFASVALNAMNDMFGSDGCGPYATLSGLARSGSLPKAGRPRWGAASLGLCCLAPLGYRGLNKAAVGAVILEAYASAPPRRLPRQWAAVGAVSLEACSCPFHTICSVGTFLEASAGGNPDRSVLYLQPLHRISPCPSSTHHE